MFYELHCCPRRLPIWPLQSCISLILGFKSILCSALFSKHKPHFSKCLCSLLMPSSVVLPKFKDDSSLLAIISISNYNNVLIKWIAGIGNMVSLLKRSFLLSSIKRYSICQLIVLVLQPAVLFWLSLTALINLFPAVFNGNAEINSLHFTRPFYVIICMWCTACWGVLPQVTK